jgi:hypothetical protein
MMLYLVDLKKTLKSDKYFYDKKPTAFPYINNEQTKKIRKTIPFTIAFDWGQGLNGKAFA